MRREIERARSTETETMRERDHQTQTVREMGWKLTMPSFAIPLVDLEEEIFGAFHFDGK